MEDKPRDRDTWALVVKTDSALSVTEKARRFRALRFMLTAAARLCGVEIESGPKMRTFLRTHGET